VTLCGHLVTEQTSEGNSVLYRTRRMQSESAQFDQSQDVRIAHSLFSQ
jgi:hypothetical protein